MHGKLRFADIAGQHDVGVVGQDIPDCLWQDVAAVVWTDDKQTAFQPWMPAAEFIESPDKFNDAFVAAYAPAESDGERIVTDAVTAAYVGKVGGGDFFGIEKPCGIDAATGAGADDGLFAAGVQMILYRQG